MPPKKSVTATIELCNRGLVVPPTATIHVGGAELAIPERVDGQTVVSWRITRALQDAGYQLAGSNV